MGDDSGLKFKCGDKSAATIAPGLGRWQARSGLSENAGCPPSANSLLRRHSPRHTVDTNMSSENSRTKVRDVTADCDTSPAAFNRRESTAEAHRLAEDGARQKNWKRWGPYLSERQWATVREDY